MGRIERHIDDSRTHPGSLQDLCVATGLALRTVETIIRERLNMSAQAYIRQRRLAFAREDLLNAAPGTTVTDIALQNGFAHFGRFAAYYRQTYGETPSRTLRR